MVNVVELVLQKVSILIWEMFLTDDKTVWNYKIKNKTDINLGPLQYTNISHGPESICSHCLINSIFIHAHTLTFVFLITPQRHHIWRVKICTHNLTLTQSLSVFSFFDFSKKKTKFIKKDLILRWRKNNCSKFRFSSTLSYRGGPAYIQGQLCGHETLKEWNYIINCHTKNVVNYQSEMRAL